MAIKVKIKMPAFEARERNFITCPNCTAEDYFFTRWPARCPFCKVKFPVAFENTMYNLTIRRMYHTQGRQKNDEGNE